MADLFATCARGLEAELQREVAELRLARPERQVGGVAFRGELADVWKANLGLRTAGRVLWRLARFEAADSNALYAGAREVPWERWVAPEGSLAVRARTSDSELTHSGFVAQRVKDAVCDHLRERFGVRPSVDREAPELAIYAHVARNRCTLLADSSGESLYKRGWRRFQGRAPLAETLAAGCVMLSGWDRRAPLVDPFCGSGTLLVEAALLASAAPPGQFRSFAFERWPGHDARAWAEFRAERAARASRPRRLILQGSDSDPGAIAGARENLAAAGLDDWIELEVLDARDREWKRGWNAQIATNPPFGERLGSPAALELVYRAFGRRVAAACAGYRMAVLCSRPELVAALGLEARRRLPLANGPLECELALFEL